MAEIKSAYRKLAREKHPDLSDDEYATGKEFVSIARAYGVLSDPNKRAEYDKALLRVKYQGFAEDSIFGSKNPHAKRARQMAYEKRFNEINDRIILEERNQTRARQRVIFPIVSLFVATAFVGMLKPRIWMESSVAGRVVIFTLFVAGSIHLARRIRDGFSQYTSSKELDLLFDDLDDERHLYSRWSAILFLFGGLIVSFIIGNLIAPYLAAFIISDSQTLFSRQIHAEFLFYPPIAVFLVDSLHAILSRFER